MKTPKISIEINSKSSVIFYFLQLHSSLDEIEFQKIHQKNWIQLVSVLTGDTQVTARDCLINSLRMRPDRILVGECRRDETFEMLQAMNTGHEGSMTTIHSNSPNDCLTRLENLLYSAGFEVTQKFLRRQISDTVNFIIQLKRNTRGQRIVSQIIELTGMEGDVITRTILFDTNNSSQELVPTGLVPKVVEIIETRTEEFPEEFFKRDNLFKSVG